MKKLLITGLALMGIALFAGCKSGESTSSIPAVTPFSLDKYLGTWHEIARLPHSFEQGMDQVTATYSLRPDGKVNVENIGFRNGEKHSATGVALFTGDSNVGELKVSFFGPFYGGYKIIYLEPDYSTAIVTSGSKDYLWILSRTPTLPQKRLDSYVQKIKAWGFPVDQLQYPTPKLP